jgi:hypothetical protein
MAKPVTVSQTQSVPCPVTGVYKMIYHRRSIFINFFFLTQEEVYSNANEDITINSHRTKQGNPAGEERAQDP